MANRVTDIKSSPTEKRNYIIIASILIVLGVVVGGLVLFQKNQSGTTSLITSQTGEIDTSEEAGMTSQGYPLQIEEMRKGEYPGSDIVIEQELELGLNYKRYIASYKSDGLKIFGLLTIPNGQRPTTGWPAIVFNHGYIAPSEYRTTERYVAYQDGFARNGYITFKSDYRGHANSEGEGSGAYGSTAYVVDVLNAVSSIKRYKDADPDHIGMWGHSMGGYITLRSMVISKDIKAGVIWAGVVASYPDLVSRWRRGTPMVTPTGTLSRQRRWRQELQERFGTPDSNPEFWNSISANSYLDDISGPLQLHHGTADTSVPYEFSTRLEEQMKKAGKVVEYFEYEGDDHNIAYNFNTAIQRSIDFFDKYVKGE